REPGAAAAPARPPGRALRAGPRGRARHDRGRARGRLRARGADRGGAGSAAICGREGVDRGRRRESHRQRGRCGVAERLPDPGDPGPHEPRLGGTRTDRQPGGGRAREIRREAGGAMSSQETQSRFATVEEAIEDIRQGKMVVVCDDEDRENKGDLTLAAQFATPEAINFMAKEGRGLICLALTPDRCDELGLDLMAAKNESPFETAFTVSVEAREGVSTGISAADRARTIQVAIDPSSAPRDLVQPGHI